MPCTKEVRASGSSQLQQPSIVLLRSHHNSHGCKAVGCAGPAAAVHVANRRSRHPAGCCCCCCCRPSTSIGCCPCGGPGAAAISCSRFSRNGFTGCSRRGAWPALRGPGPALLGPPNRAASGALAGCSCCCSACRFRCWRCSTARCARAVTTCRAPRTACCCSSSDTGCSGGSKARGFALGSGRRSRLQSSSSYSLACRCVRTGTGARCSAANRAGGDDSGQPHAAPRAPPGRSCQAGLETRAPKGQQTQHSSYSSCNACVACCGGCPPASAAPALAAPPLAAAAAAVPGGAAWHGWPAAAAPPAGGASRGFVSASGSRNKQSCSRSMPCSRLLQQT